MRRLLALIVLAGAASTEASTVLYPLASYSDISQVRHLGKTLSGTITSEWRSGYETDFVSDPLTLDVTISGAIGVSLSNSGWRDSADLLYPVTVYRRSASGTLTTVCSVTLVGGPGSCIVTGSVAFNAGDRVQVSLANSQYDAGWGESSQMSFNIASTWLEFPQNLPLPDAYCGQPPASLGPCADWTCTPSGWQASAKPAWTSCSDGNACNGNELCNGSGVCVAGIPLQVDDQDPFTIDRCDPVLGVTHTRAATAGTSLFPLALASQYPGLMQLSPNLTGPTGSETVSGGVAGFVSQPVTQAAVVSGTVNVGLSASGWLDSSLPVWSVGVMRRSTVGTLTPLCTATTTEIHATCQIPSSALLGSGDRIEVLITNAVFDAGWSESSSFSYGAPGTWVEFEQPLPFAPEYCGTTARPLDQCTDWSCTSTGWQGAPLNVDDMNPCTTDSCDPSIGILHVPLAAGASCSDGNACNGVETCDGGGHCQVGTPVSVDDGNPCTDDSCDPSVGPIHTVSPPGTSCSDGDVCNGEETCDGLGVCQRALGLPVDDGDPCTADACVTGRGVVHTPIPGCQASATCDPKPGVAFVHDPAGNLTAVVNTSVDAQNCGCLGYTCATSGGGTASCLGGVCGVNVGGNWINTGSDPLNCGSVGNTCAAPAHAAPTCVSGRCGFSCQWGYVQTDTTCLDLTSDPYNCGWVGNVCPGSAPATPVCVSGECATEGDRPLIQAVNGIAPPGVAFRSPAAAGITILGTGLASVTYLELEDCGADSDVNHEPTTPSCDGGGAPVGPPVVVVPFIRKATELVIPEATNVPNGEWLKVRVHFQEGGLDAFDLVNVAVSLDGAAPIASGPPQITDVDALRILEADPSGYDWTTGFVSIVDKIVAPGDLTQLSPAPSALMGHDALQTEYRILAITKGGFYIRAGLDPAVVLDVEVEKAYVSVVFPHVSPGRGAVHLAPDYRQGHPQVYPYFASQLAPGVILRGAHLWSDASLGLANPPGSPLEGNLSKVVYFGDRAVVTPIDNPSNASAYIEVTSPRGSTSTTWPLRWSDAPAIQAIGSLPYVPYDQALTVTGTWFVDVNSIAFSVGPLGSSGLSMTEYLIPTPTSPPGDGQFFVVDDKHILLRLSSTGTVPRQLAAWCESNGLTTETFPGFRKFTVYNSDGSSQAQLFALDRMAAAPPTPAISCPIVHIGGDGGGPTGGSPPQPPVAPIIDIFPPGSQCGSNQICLP